MYEILLINIDCSNYGKINGIPKYFYLPTSKLHSILAITNLLAHNNKTISYYLPVNLLWLKSSVASKWASKHFLGVSFILLLMVLVFKTLSCYLINIDPFVQPIKLTLKNEKNSNISEVL